MSQLELEFMMSVLADYDEDRHLQIQTDSPGVDGAGGTRPAEALSPHGFISRPLDADKGAAETEIGLGAPGLCVTAGDHRYLIPFTDPRDVPKLPKVRKGGSMQYGGAGDYRSFALFDGEDPNGVGRAGSYTLGVSYGSGGVKKTLGFSLDIRTAGKESISLVHGEGQRMTFGADGLLEMRSASGSQAVMLNDDGTVITGEAQVSGSLTVGDLSAEPLAKGPELVEAIVVLVSAIEAMLTTGAALEPRVAAVWPSIAGPLLGIAPLLAQMQSRHVRAS